MASEETKLKVQEVGPYCYRLYRNTLVHNMVIIFKCMFRETLFRVNITDHKNDSQSFNEMRVQHFDYEASNGIDTEDFITVPDIPYIVRIYLFPSRKCIINN